MAGSRDMPPPVVPDKASKKRKRTESGAASVSASSSASASASAVVRSASGRVSSASAATRSTAFSEPVRTAIKDLMEWKCFACGANTLLEAAHVIQRHDSAVSVLQDRGLLDVDVNAKKNGVSLCSTCHKEYDKDDAPGFMFWPADLDFFIAAKLDYRQATPANRPARRVPSAQDYASHQNGPDATSNGSYTRLFFRFYMSPWVAPDLASLNRQGTPAAWHGTPFGTLRRAFAVIGSPYVNVLPIEIEEKLVTLKNLYYRDDIDINSIPHPYPTTRHVVKDQSQDPSTPPTKGLGQNTAQKNSEHAHINEEEWTLGPSTTSQQLMDRFGPGIAAAAAANPRNIPFPGMFM